MSIKKDKGLKLEKILKKDKTQKILNYWKNKPDTWIQSCKIREFFVKGIQKFIYLFDNEKYKDIETGKIYQEKPKPIYNNDSQLYRDLKELVEYGILKNKEVPQKKGKPFSYYRPNIAYKKEGLRIQNKNAFDLYPQDKIISFTIIKSNSKHIVYGLSEELIGFNKQIIQDCLNNIEDNLIKIENIINNARNKKIEKKIDSLMKKTKSKNIKKMLKEREAWILAVVDDTIFANEDNVSRIPKHIFELNIKYASNVKPGTQFNFSKKDIKEMTEWGWKNRFFIHQSHPFSIAFSRYKEYEENFLSNQI